MRLIDVDALESEGWLLCKTFQKDKSTMVHEVKKPSDFPTIEERKTGKWIYGENDGQDGWYCSECNSFIPWDYDYYGLDNIDFIKDFKTCPFCDKKMTSYTGADMRQEGEEDG